MPLLVSLAAAILLAASPMAASPALAGATAQKDLERPHATVTERAARATFRRNVGQVLVHAPGERSVEMLSVFRLQLTRIVPLPWRSVRERLRPYVLGGRTTTRLPAALGLSRSGHAFQETSTLRVGAGAELILREGLSLNLDGGEVIYRGALRSESHKRYNLGFTLGF